MTTAAGPSAARHFPAGPAVYLLSTTRKQVQHRVDESDYPATQASFVFLGKALKE